MNVILDSASAAYLAPSGTVNLSSGAGPSRIVYASGFFSAITSAPSVGFTGSQFVYAVGIDSPALGSATAKLVIAAPGIPPGAFGATRVSAKSVVALNVSAGAYTQPSGSVYLNLGLSGIAAVYVSGIAPKGFGNAYVQNSAQGVRPAGISLGAFGAAMVLNRTQFVAPAGFPRPPWDETNSGSVDLYRRHITPASILSWEAGTASVVNTTATQFAAPSSIGDPGLGSVMVRGPRVVEPYGFAAPIYGVPRVQFPPRPVGFDSSVIGIPTVRDNRQSVGVPTLPTTAWGLPSTRRLVEIVTPTSLPETTLFGDARADLHRRYVLTAGADTSFVSPFAAAVNVNRYLLVPGLAGAVGAAAVRNASPNITPVPITGAVGTPSVGGYYRTLYAANWRSDAYGTPTVRNAAMSITPVPFFGDIGQPVVTFRVRSLNVLGITPPPLDGDDDSTMVVDFLRRLVRDAGGSDMYASGTARVENQLRAVLPASAASEEAFGTTFVSFARRHVEPGSITYIVGTNFGGVDVRDARQVVLVPGIPPLLVGQHTTFRDEQVVAPAGIAGNVGVAMVDWGTRYVLARSFLSEEKFGATTIFNSRQYVRPFLDPVGAIESGAVGTPWDVSNVDRVVRTFGFDMSTVARGAQVSNNGRIVAPSGVQGVFGNALVASRVRTVQVSGFDSFFSNYTAVYNSSRVLEPSGVGRGRVGVPAIRDNRQVIDAAGGTQHTAIGVGMVAYRIRTVAPGSIEAPRLRDIDVQLYTRRVAPLGFDLRMGAVTVEEKFSVIKNSGYDMSRYGEAFVKNVTPEVHVFPSDLTEFGLARAYLRNNYVDLAGFSITAKYGNATVEDRVRHVYPGGFSGMRIPLLHDVYFDAPQLPPGQIVEPLPIRPPNENGVPSDNDVPRNVGTPFLQLRGAIVPGAIYTKFGTAVVTSNVIGPPLYILDIADQVGIPSLNGTQYVAPPSVEFKLPNEAGMGDGHLFIGIHRLNPVTITLSEAIDIRHVVDYDDVWGVERPKWGEARVEHGTRYVSPDGVTAFRSGDAEVTTRIRYIYPAGIKAFKYGVPVIPNNNSVFPYWGRETIEEVPGVNIDPARYGEVSVAYAPLFSRPVYPVPFVGEVGVPGVTLFNRTITQAGGIDSQLYGVAYVGPPRVIYGVGSDLAEFGTTWVSLKIRTVQVDSTDLTTRFDIDFSAGIPRPMRVYKNSVLRPVGWLSEALGDAQIGDVVGSIKPPSFGQPIFGTATISSSARVAPAGFDSLVMGVPKRPVYGTVEPAGFDAALFGKAVLNRIIHAPYVERGLVGAPSVGSSINVPGLAGVFGNAVVVGESNCASKLAVVATIGEQTIFGQPGVHQ